MTKNKKKYYLDMPLSWSTIILLCTGFAILSLRETNYIHSKHDASPSHERRRSESDDDVRHRPTGGIGTSERRSTNDDDDESADVDFYDIRDYDASNGMTHVGLEGKVGRGGKLADFVQPEDGTIRSISLLGERNSGTRWIFG